MFGKETNNGEVRDPLPQSFERLFIESEKFGKLEKTLMNETVTWCFLLEIDGRRDPVYPEESGGS